jgi:hypothetical protein
MAGLSRDAPPVNNRKNTGGRRSGRWSPRDGWSRVGRLKAAAETIVRAIPSNLDQRSWGTLSTAEWRCQVSAISYAHTRARPVRCPAGQFHAHRFAFVCCSRNPRRGRALSAEIWSVAMVSARAATPKPVNTEQRLSDSAHELAPAPSFGTAFLRFTISTAATVGIMVTLAAL